MYRYAPVASHTAWCAAMPGDHTVVGMEPHESQGTLAWLTAHISQPALVYYHVWQPGDLVMWDNRAVLHRGTPYDTSLERRVVRRTVLKGDAPY